MPSGNEQSNQLVCHCNYPKGDNRIVCGYCHIWDWVLWKYGDFEIEL